MKNYIVKDEIFDRLNWTDIELNELLGCFIIGAEPINKDNIAEDSNTVGLILYVEDINKNKFAVEIKHENEPEEIFISKAGIYEA